MSGGGGGAGHAHDAEAPRWPHHGAILAGGAGRRMGAPKHAVRLADGWTMIEHVAAPLRAICRDVVVVGGPEGALAGARTIADRRNALGPLGGIEALLMSDLDEQYLVVPCDLPRLTVRALAALTVEDDHPATVLRVGAEDAPRPLPARIAASAAPLASALLDRGERAVWRFIEQAGARIIDVPAEWAIDLRNVNRPEDAAAERSRG